MRWLKQISLFLLLITGGELFAGAPYCALRDPSHQIYEMYPLATSYRSVVREVDSAARDSLSQQLPFSLHSNELGEHTVYVPVNDKTPLGIVHVRSESSDWGLMEIVWALGYKMEITDFQFQRCRGSGCRSLLKKGLKALLHGKTEAGLIALLTSDHKVLKVEHADAMELSRSEIDLATSVAKSAIKTIAVTKNTWPTTVAEVQAVKGNL